ncbi:hypothetical protein BGZ63DRAFT_150683 [Mariannaea sp. PMI_226]|nr:hypothetical protein BGZ63DRAFT_150683 [Mariannaea sp. PMI_226]
MMLPGSIAPRHDEGRGWTRMCKPARHKLAFFLSRPTRMSVRRFSGCSNPLLFIPLIICLLTYHIIHLSTHRTISSSSLIFLFIPSLEKRLSANLQQSAKYNSKHRRRKKTHDSHHAHAILSSYFPLPANFPNPGTENDRHTHGPVATYSDAQEALYHTRERSHNGAR